jgi:predicted O-methyltransferase YrrM
MTHTTHADLDSYRLDLFVHEDAVLRRVMPEATAAGLPGISVSADAGQMLHLLAAAVGARKILEFGSLAGYSGIWLARALPSDGRLISLELDEEHAAVTRSNFERAGVGDRTEVRVGPALETMATVADEAPFDVAFIDADKENYPGYLEFSLEHVRSGGLIIADNANGHGRAHEVLDESDGRRGIQDYNRRVAEDERLVSHIIPVGGWLAVSVVVR